MEYSRSGWCFFADETASLGPACGLAAGTGTAEASCMPAERPTVCTPATAPLHSTGEQQDETIGTGDGAARLCRYIGTAVVAGVA